MIVVKNLKTYHGDGFNCGRPSPLGNPFKIDAKNSREKVIAQYREWLLERLRTDNPTTKAFLVLCDYYRENGELTLTCHCAPLSCHCDVIKEFIEEMMRK